MKVFTFESKDGCSWENRKQYVWTGIFNFCGCYDHGLFNLFFEMLESLYEAKKKDDCYFYKYEDVSDEFKQLQELILHVLDSKEIAEHGTSVRGCWLTDKGFELGKFIFDNGDEPTPKRGME